MADGEENRSMRTTAAPMKARTRVGSDSENCRGRKRGPARGSSSGVGTETRTGVGKLERREGVEVDAAPLLPPAAGKVSLWGPLGPLGCLAASADGRGEGAYDAGPLGCLAASSSSSGCRHFR